LAKARYMGARDKPYYCLLRSCRFQRWIQNKNRHTSTPLRSYPEGIKVMKTNMSIKHRESTIKYRLMEIFLEFT